MIKPPRLKKGDTIAAVSLSAGLAGEKKIMWRYTQGKAQLEALGFHVVEMKMTLENFEEVYQNPQKRAHDLHQALLDSSIKGIIACIGGDESVRMLPYIDFDLIRQNPKVFIGYSDSTSIHMMFYKAGVVSYYGPNVLVDFAENKGIHPFTRAVFEAVLMDEYEEYIYPWRDEWTSQRLEWIIENKDIKRSFTQETKPELIQGEGYVEGVLMGGCLDVFTYLRATPLYPDLNAFKNTILFLETSEGYMKPDDFLSELRTMAVMGILQNAKAILFGKPQDNKYYVEYKMKIKQVVQEFNLQKLMIITNAPFGHTEPKWTLPLGIKASFDSETMTLKLLENAVEIEVKASFKV